MLLLNKVCSLLLQYNDLAGSSVTVSLESVADLVGNTNLNVFSWTFVVEETACGRAEFLGNLASSQLALNSASSLASGINVSVYNPDQSVKPWIDNLRIQSIALVYRKLHSSDWVSALDMQGNAAEFYDDVRRLHLVRKLILDH